MCGFVGFVNYKEDTLKMKNILLNMNTTLSKRGPDEEDFFIDKNVALAHKRLIVIDPNGGTQPMIEKQSYGEYVIVYNGQIYNTKELRKTLIENGFTFNGHCDTEVLLKSYIHYGNNVVNHLNGIFAFAIWNSRKKELFLARDHFGVKPLFYTIKNGSLIFSSEIKALFEYPEIRKELDNQGICELFGIGPAHTPGTTIFKNIYEIKPSHYAIFNAYASHYCKKNGLPPLDTYSIDYVDNDKNFVKSDFQPNSDNYYINLMNKNLHTNHHQIVIDTPELASYLEDAMIARDMPGMADIDSSLLLFCKNVKNEMTVSLTGECADEIFGGYPWFFREDALNSGTFPWSIAIEERQKLLNPYISSKINLKNYIDYRYNESLSEVEILDCDTKETAEKRKISHLTLNWFMQTLLDRSDRMSMYNGFELRVPFCDYRLAQYVWNIPWEMKALNGREKGLLRHICRDFLPDEIIDRKKSPYPKTHNPSYLAKVKVMLSDIMKDKNAPINSLLNRDYILEILNSDGSAFSRPWFGQLMTGPQLMAYLCQVNMWLERYQPKIEI